MKLMSSACTCSAAMIRSPSFSRLASSSMMTMRPARRSATMSSMGLKAMGVTSNGKNGKVECAVLYAVSGSELQHAIQVAGHNIHFQIHRIAKRPIAQVRMRHGMRHYVDTKVVAIHFVHGEADAVYADRALGRDKPRQRIRHREHEPPGSRIGGLLHQFAHAV